MLRLIKAEMVYRWWQPILMIFLLALIGRLFVDIDGKSNSSDAGQWLVSFVTIALLMAGYFVKMQLQNREFTENRVKLYMMLPVDVKSVGNARVLHYTITMLMGLPIWFFVITSIPIMTEWQRVWLLLSLIGFMLAMALVMSFANELQYLPQQRKGLTLLAFWSFALIFMPVVFGMAFDPVREFFVIVAKQFVMPWGAAAFLALAWWIGSLNVKTFLKRENFARTHKPEITIFDFFRTFRGEKQYREMK